MSQSLKRKLQETKTIKCPFAINWIIPKNLIEGMTEHEEFLVTPIYEAPNIPSVRYQLCLHPSRLIMGNIRAVAYYFLVSLGQETEVFGSHTVKIKSADFCDSNQFKYVSTDTRAPGKFIVTRNEILNPENGFFDNDKFIMQMSGTLKVYRRNMNIQEFESKKFRNQRNIESLGDAFWFSNTYDFALFVDGKRILAHKSILSVRSEVFEAMFRTNCIENNENYIDIIDFDYEIVEAAIKLCYDRNVDIDSTPLGVELLRFFDKYLMFGLKETVEYEFMPRINVKTVCKFAKIAVAHNAFELKQECVTILQECINKHIMIKDADELPESFDWYGFDLAAFSYHS